MTIFKTNIIILAITFIIGTVHAQSLSNIITSNNRVEMVTLQMKAKYDLTDQQYNSILEINKNMADKVKPILLSNQTKMEKLLAIKPLMKERENALKDVFNKDQLDAFYTIKDQRKALFKAWLDE